MRRGYFALGLPLVAGVTVIASLSAATAVARAAGCGATVKAMDGEKVVINKYDQDDMRFSPGTVTIKSGCTLTFEYGSADQSDPHTLTIVTPSQLPKTVEQVDNCSICGRLAAKHIKNPNKEPGPTNPITHWVVNAGKPGIDSPGDSVAIQEGQGAPAGHKSISIKVTAPAGTTLHFICLVHPWMQGTIKVT